MPKAVVDINDTVREDLKSLPEGFVVLKRMPYGAWLRRQEMAMHIQMEMGRGQDNKADLAMANRKVTEFEFKECLVEHNLEGHDDQLLDFRQSHTLDLLDPRVGNEIGEYIRQMHEFDLGNSPNGSKPQ